jgi:hypothetical protein
MSDFTAAELAALKASYARGISEATLPDGSRVRYRSLADMQRVIADIESDLGLRPNHTNVTYPTHKRGF